jgi:hypothetical protein
MQSATTLNHKPEPDPPPPGSFSCAMRRYMPMRLPAWNHEYHYTTKKKIEPQPGMMKIPYYDRKTAPVVLNYYMIKYSGDISWT